MQHNKIAQFVQSDKDGYFLSITLDEEFAGVKVTGISMYVYADADMCDSDLAVLWDDEGLENTGGCDMGALLMRGDGDEVGDVMGKFYWEHGFDERLQQILVDAGFSAEAASTVTGSEWGMQDEGRASYDAYDIAEEVRNAMQVTA